MIPHDLVSNMRKKYKMKRKGLFRKIINSGRFELQEVCDNSGIMYISNSDYGVSNDTLKILKNPVYLKQLINSSYYLE